VLLRLPYLNDYFSEGMSVVFQQRDLGQVLRVVPQIEGFGVPA
jgi:hypothetical protein